MKRLSAWALLLLLAACSPQGEDEEVTVNTSPDGAACTLLQDGKRIAHIDSTPDSAMLQKARSGITIECTKKGYRKAVFRDHAIASDGFFDQLFGGSWETRASSGEDNSYTITLVPVKDQ